MSRTGEDTNHALLAIDASAPVLGALCAGVLNIAPRLLAFQLSFFAGFLLYLGASDLLHVLGHEDPAVGVLLTEEQVAEVELAMREVREGKIASDERMATLWRRFGL